MKKATLTLTLFPMKLRFDPRIHGNIDHVLETIGTKAGRQNLLVDISSFRSHPGRYIMETCEGRIDHVGVLDILNAQSGILMLRPGEHLSFELEGEYILAYNRPGEDSFPYLHHGIFRGPLTKEVERGLESLRSEQLVN